MKLLPSISRTFVATAVAMAVAHSGAPMAIAAPAHPAPAQPQRQPDMSDAHAITQVMKAQFDKPEAPLTVNPVSVQGPHAVAGWMQHDRGGRALLTKRHGQWVIVACAGDALKQASTLSQAGIAPAQARQLAAKVQRAEHRLDRRYVARLALFEGYVAIDGAGHGDQATPHHAPAPGHGQHAPAAHGPDHRDHVTSHGGTKP